MGNFKFRFILWILIFTCIHVKGQEKIESKLQFIHKLQEQSLYDSALHVSDRLLSSTSLTHEQRHSIWLSKGISFYYVSKFDSLASIITKIKDDIREGDQNYPYLLFAEALLAGKHGEYELAIQKLLISLKWMEGKRGEAFLPNIYNSIGANFKSLNELLPARDYYFKARVLNKERGNKLALAMVDNNLGALYKQLNQIDSALFYYKEASELLKSLNNKLVLAQNLVNLGNIYESRNELDQALESFRRALHVSREAGIKYGEVLSILNVGNLFRLRGQLDSSELYLKQSLELSDKLGLKRERGLTLERLSWLARDKKDFKLAYELAMQSQSIHDSLLSAQTKKESLELKEKYETEKQANELMRLKSEAQRSRFIILLIILILLFVGILYIYGLYRQKKLINEKLIAEKERNELSNSLDVKDLELTNQAMQLVQLKKFLKDKQEKFIKSLDNFDPGSVEKAKESIKQDFSLDSLGVSASDLETRIKVNHEDLYKKLLSYYPDLKPAELKLCAYLRLNLSTKEIAEITNKSVRTVEATRYSVRKKIGLGSSDNLVAHLINIENS